MLAALVFAGAWSAAGDEMLLNSFEDAAALDRLKPSSAEIELSGEHVTHGERSLKITYGVADWPQVLFEAGAGYPSADWSGYGALVFDVSNPEDESLQLNVRIDDAPEADGNVHSRQSGVAIPPRRPVTVTMAIPEEALFMRAGPPAAIGDVNGSLSVGEIDLAHIIRFQFYLAHPAREHTVYIDNVRLAEAASFERIVDRFGQYTDAEWPGKVREEAGLAARRDAELSALDAASRPADRDGYGGWSEGPQLEATGWFRTEKVDGKWWLVTPSGHLFWSVGLDCVGPNSGGPIQGREDLFTWLPEEGDPLYQFGGRGTDNADFYAMNLQRKYGPESFEPWLDMTRKRMAAWGLNTVGNWAHWPCYHELRIPYTAPTHTGGSATFPGAWREIVDVYDPEWPQVAEEHITGATNTFGKDPYCIGYFVDNELPWGHWKGDARYPIPINALNLGGERPIKQAFTECLREEYGDIARLNATWGTSLDSWEQFAAEPVEIPDRQKAQPDLALLLSDFAERYFSTVAEIVHRQAPNQLYLGPRFAVTTPEVLEVAARHCDVLSFNIYGKAENLVAYAENLKHVDRPMLIGEFHFGALDRGMFHGGLVPVPTQEDRGAEYAKYVRTALEQPWCVGAHWFQYIDEPLTGRFDGENYNIGFVSITDTPYPELVRQAAEVNFGIYKARGG